MLQAPGADARSPTQPAAPGPPDPQPAAPPKEQHVTISAEAGQSRPTAGTARRITVRALK
ncbi:hypothetical protein OG883_41125 [Streptomyces sp. NBC_01142]|uniref:hypothetical protein n=1 Tax=Streptomyces sp. NBC_01142 TaxID=2975865 RepID=UPI0022586D73|nr:hypothetical protein [Streptomyces sp. NBC_01142]MCX4826075.1 hypothetical protein [Streptomyces sp. NBC_01142]